MRKFGMLAAVLACASVGVLAAVSPAADAQDEKTPRTESKRKTIVVERHGDDDGPNGDVLIRRFGVEDGARIGVSVANLDEEQAKTKAGVVVTDVQENGPGAKAGLKEKDVITEFDGEKVRSARQLRRLVSETPAGRTVKLAAERDGKRVELQVIPEAQEMAWSGGMGPGMDPFTPDRMPRMHPEMGPGPERRQFHFQIPEGERQFEFRTPGWGGDEKFDVFVAPGRGRLGVSIQDLSEQLAEYFGTKDGVLVSSVTKDSPAARAGIRAGDVITSVDEKPVTSSTQLIEAVQEAGESATLKVGYLRDKKPATATATLEPRERPKRPTRPV